MVRSRFCMSLHRKIPAAYQLMQLPSSGRIVYTSDVQPGCAFLQATLLPSFLPGAPDFSPANCHFANQVANHVFPQQTEHHLGPARSYRGGDVLWT
ncbi:hypothetical protein AUP68_02522 [Ilyonectria robusta]